MSTIIATAQIDLPGAGRIGRFLQKEDNVQKFLDAVWAQDRMEGAYIVQSQWLKLVGLTIVSDLNTRRPIGFAIELEAGPNAGKFFRRLSLHCFEAKAQLVDMNDNLAIADPQRLLQEMLKSDSETPMQRVLNQYSALLV